MIYQAKNPHAAGVTPGLATLHVIGMVSNPVRYASRYRLLDAFRAQTVGKVDVKFHLAEVALRHRQFVGTTGAPGELQLRCDDELWHKENALNLTVAKVLADDPTAEYFAFVDADVTFARPDWAEETLHQLQHYQVVQMFSTAQDVGPKFDPLGKVHTGFVYAYCNDENFHGDKAKQWGYTSGGHPGYAWAWRREALDAVGGLIDYAIVGGGDRHMACGLIGTMERSGPSENVDVIEAVSNGFGRELMRWQKRAEALKKNVGYVDGLLLHHFHGRKVNRHYANRWKIYTENNYCPHGDLKRQANGLYAFGSDKVKLRDDLRSYFRARDEDSLEVE